jgi:hypothetical protein
MLPSPSPRADGAAGLPTIRHPTPRLSAFPPPGVDGLPGKAGTMPGRAPAVLLHPRESNSFAFTNGVSPAGSEPASNTECRWLPRNIAVLPPSVSTDRHAPVAIGTAVATYRPGPMKLASQRPPLLCLVRTRQHKRNRRPHCPNIRYSSTHCRSSCCLSACQVLC